METIVLIAVIGTLIVGITITINKMFNYEEC